MINDSLLEVDKIMNEFTHIEMVENTESTLEYLNKRVSQNLFESIDSMVQSIHGFGKKRYTMDIDFPPEHLSCPLTLVDNYYSRIYSESQC